MSRRWLGLALPGAFLLLAGWHLVLRRGQLSLPLMRDEGEYACVAKVWAAGGLPYRDAFSQKPPMIFALYRMAYAAWPSQPLAPRSVLVLFSLATMALLLAMTPGSWPLEARLCAPAAFGAAATWPIGSLGFAANTESVLCAFTALCALALLRSWSSRRPAAWIALCGLSAGAALMTKQTALPTVAGFGALALASGRGAKARAALYGACALLAPALFAAYFGARGGLADAWRAVYARNMDYARLALQTGTAWSQGRWFLSSVLPLFARVGWPLAVLAAAALWRRSAKARSLETTAVVWLGCATAGAVTGLFLFPYYFLQAFPALALLAAAGAARLEGRWRGAAVAALCLVCVYPAAADFGLYFRRSGPQLASALLSPNPIYEARGLGLFLRGRSLPSDRLYVYGSEAQIYVYADRRAATSHVMAYPLTLFPKDQAFDDAELGALERVRPRYVVFSTQKGSTLIASAIAERFRDRIEDWLSADYRWIGLAPLGRADGSFITGADLGPPRWDQAPALLVFERKSRLRR